MSQYRAYPAYKDSGVEWIGQVPEHWEVKRLKHLTSQCQNGVWGDDPLEDGSDTLCIRVADFDRDNNAVINNPSTYRQISKEHQDSRLVSKGDILLEKSGGGAQTLVGANVRYMGEEPAVCSNFVAVVKTSERAESGWLNYLMASMYALKINLRSIKQSTGIQNLDSEQYLHEGIAAPSIEEQATIAAALDRETARIDALIEKKNRFIELLKEKRQALITHAVTKGLDPNAKMKDSGVEWIGQVPEHWEVKRLKHLTSQCQNGVWGDDPLEDGSDTLCIRVADFDRDNNAVINNPSTYRQISKEHQDSRLVSKGDILLEKSGGGEQTLVGANVRYMGEEPAVCSNFVAVVKTSERAESGWLNYLMASMYALKINLRSIKQSTGIQNLDSEQYLHEGIAAPSIEEQASIAATLDRETARIDALISKAEQSITLLKERRAAFITAAVTGQIDLRGKQ